MLFLVMLPILLLSSLVDLASASHFRYGSIHYWPTSPTNVTFKLDFVFRRDYEWGRYFQEMWSNETSSSGDPIFKYGGVDGGPDPPPNDPTMTYQRVFANFDKVNYHIRLTAGVRVENIPLAQRGGRICNHWLDEGYAPLCKPNQPVKECKSRTVVTTKDANGDLVIDVTKSPYEPVDCCAAKTWPAEERQYYCAETKETHGFFFGDGDFSPLDMKVERTVLPVNAIKGSALVSHRYPAATDASNGNLPYKAFFTMGNRLTYLNNNARGRIRLEVDVEIAWNGISNEPNNVSPIATSIPILPVPYTSRGSNFARFSISAYDPDVFNRIGSTFGTVQQELNYELAPLTGYGGQIAHCISDGRATCLEEPYDFRDKNQFVYSKANYTERRNYMIQKYCQGDCSKCPKSCSGTLDQVGGRPGVGGDSYGDGHSFYINGANQRMMDTYEWDRCFDCEKYPAWDDAVNLPGPPKDLYLDRIRGEVLWETGSMEFETDASAYPDQSTITDSRLAEFSLSQDESYFGTGKIYCGDNGKLPWKPDDQGSTSGCINKDVAKKGKRSGYYNLVVSIKSRANPRDVQNTNMISVPLDFLLYLYPPMHYCGRKCQNDVRKAGIRTFADPDGHYGFSDKELEAKDVDLAQSNFPDLTKPTGYGTGSCTICGGGTSLPRSLDAKDASYCSPDPSDYKCSPAANTQTYIKKGFCPGVRVDRIVKGDYPFDTTRWSGGNATEMYAAPRQTSKTGFGLYDDRVLNSLFTASARSEDQNETTVWTHNENVLSPKQSMYYFGKDSEYGQYFGGCDQPKASNSTSMESYIVPTVGACYINTAPYFVYDDSYEKLGDRTPLPHPNEAAIYAPTARINHLKGTTATFSLVAADDDSCVELGIMSLSLIHI